MTMNATKAEVLTEDEQQRFKECWNQDWYTLELAKIIDRLIGELTSLRASRDEVVKAAQDVADISHEYKRDWITEDEWDKFFALQSALAQVSAPAPAPAKEGVVLFEWLNQQKPSRTIYASKYKSGEVWYLDPQKDMWAQSEDPCFDGPDDDEWSDHRRLSDSEAAAFLKEHPLPKDAFSPTLAPAAPATSGAGEQRSAVDVMRSRLQGAFTVVMSTDSNKGSPNAVVQMIEEFIDAKLAALTAPKSAITGGGR